MEPSEAGPLIVAHEIDRVLKLLRRGVEPELYRKCYVILANFARERGMVLRTRDPALQLRP